MPRDLNFAPKAFEQYKDWARLDKKLQEKLNDLIDECARTPHEGKGKPEPLKGKQYKGYWSRRINDEHRLIYKADDDTVYILSCYGHYDDK